MQTSRIGTPRSVRRRSLVYLVAMNLALSLAAAVGLPSVAAASPLPGGAPGLPETLAVPAQPIVGTSSAVGYLPGSWSVTPTGAFTYTIPVDVPDGRAGVQPRLSLVYNSGAGNGP